MAEVQWDQAIESMNRSIKGAGWSAIRSDSRLTWLGRFLSDVVLAVGLREIEHLDSRADVSSAGLSARIVVFTSDTVVVADASGVSLRDDDVLTSVTAQPRAGLKRLWVSGSRSLWDHDSFEPWPGDFRVVATWDNGTEVALPLAPIEYDSQRQGFMRIFEALSKQLGS